MRARAVEGVPLAQMAPTNKCPLYSEAVKFYDHEGALRVCFAASVHAVCVQRIWSARPSVRSL